MPAAELLESKTEANEPKVDKYGNTIVDIKNFDEVPNQGKWVTKVIYRLRKQGEASTNECYSFYGNGRCGITTTEKFVSAKGRIDTRVLNKETINSSEILKLLPQIEKFNKLKSQLSNLSSYKSIYYPVGNDEISIGSNENRIAIVKDINLKTETTNDDMKTVIVLEFSKGKFYTSEKNGTNRIELKTATEINAMLTKIDFRIKEYETYKEAERLKKTQNNLRHASVEQNKAEEDLENNLNNLA